LKISLFADICGILGFFCSCVAFYLSVSNKKKINFIRDVISFDYMKNEHLLTIKKIDSKVHEELMEIILKRTTDMTTITNYIYELNEALDNLLVYDIWTIDAKKELVSLKVDYINFINRLNDYRLTSEVKRHEAFSYGNYSESQINSLYDKITTKVIALIQNKNSLQKHAQKESK
jgi:hypothetical protein